MNAYEYKPCYCCDKDERDNWLFEPCCNFGECKCTADTYDEKETLSMCIHCGGQMFKENGFWFDN